jgi:hypothetical protein
MEEVQKTQDIEGKRINNKGHVSPTLQPGASENANHEKDTRHKSELKPLPE